MSNIKWNKLVIKRVVTEEEKEEYEGHDYFWEGVAPEIDEEVLVSDGRRVWRDNWIEIDNGVNFEYFEIKENATVHWMSFPKPPRFEYLGEIKMNKTEQLKELKNQLSELNIKIKELEEEIRNDKQWVPEKGESYWTVLTDGDVSKSYWDGYNYDYAKLSIGNVFRTKEEAEFEVERLKVLAEMKKYATPFIFDQDDYDNDDVNYHLCLDPYGYSILIEWEPYLIGNTIYFDSKETAQIVIEEIGEDRLKKYYFGITE